MLVTFEFSKGNPSNIVLESGPSAKEQLSSLCNGTYWTVLNSSLINFGSDEKLKHRINAFKHSLQTYGPIDKDNLPDFRNNTGSAKGEIYHGHVNDGNGKTHVVEWTVIDHEKKIMAIVGFDFHENYPFLQNPLKSEQKEQILSSAESIKIFNRVAENIKTAIKKAERIIKNSPKRSKRTLVKRP